MLLAAAIAANSATLQLVVAASVITFVQVTGSSRLLGLGPALFLLASALSSMPAGRLMDRVGRVPVLAGGFVIGAIGSAVTGLGAYISSGLLVVPGFMLIGTAAATAQLARAAAGDMYPPAHRARGIAFVMFGAIFGAILGPTVFGPLFKDRELTPRVLSMGWFAGAGMMLVALTIVLFIRPDPKTIAEALERDAAPTDAPARPMVAASLGEMLRRPGVLAAMMAGVFSFAVMVAMMNLTGYIVVGHRHHSQDVVFPIIGAHVVGMYLLLPIVGTLIDRVGRGRARVAGLTLIAAATGGLGIAEGVVPIAVMLFVLGLGWNLAFVAATTQLADLAAPWERGKLLGFHDFVAALTGAAFVLLGGSVLDGFGVTALALGGALVALAPTMFMVVSERAARTADATSA
jgi:MFS family permease